MLYKMRGRVSKSIFLSQSYQMKYSFGSNFRNGVFDGFTVYGTLNSSKIVFFLTIGVHYKGNSKTNYSRNSKSGILHLYHMQILLEIFLGDLWNRLCIRAHRRILIHRIWSIFFQRISIYPSSTDSWAIVGKLWKRLGNNGLAYQQ